MLINENKGVKDRRYTSQLNNYPNAELLMSKIQAAKATEQNINHQSQSFQQSSSFVRRTNSVLSVDGANLKNRVAQQKIIVNSQRFESQDLNYGKKHPIGNNHTFSQNNLGRPQFSQYLGKSQAQSVILSGNNSVIERNYSQLLNQISNAQVFQSPFMQKQRIIQITKRNSHSQINSYSTHKKPVDPQKLSTFMKPTWAITKGNLESDRDQEETKDFEPDQNLNEELKKKKYLKETAIWQQIRDQDSQHQDVPYYLTEHNYQDWQQRAQTPPSPTVDEMVDRELYEQAQLVKEKQQGTNQDLLLTEDSQKKRKKIKQVEDDAEHSVNSLNEEEERKFAELKYLVNNYSEERKTQFDYQTKKNLDYFGVVLPGTQKDQKEYQKQYQETLMHKYSIKMSRKKDFVNKVKRKKNLTPLQKFQQNNTNMLNLGLSSLRAMLPVDVSQKAFERLKDREEDVVYEELRDKTIEELLKNQEQLKGYILTDNQMKESLIQENKVFVTDFSRKLLTDLQQNTDMGRKDNRLLQEIIQNTKKVIKKNNIVQKLTQYGASGQNVVQVEKDKDQQDQQNEIFYQSRLKQNFYNSLKQTIFPCQDEMVYQEFQRQCYIENKVLGLPAMTKITQDGTLSLVGYKLNTGLCQNLGTFLEKHTTANDPFIVRKLILDDNFMKDGDLASLLKGISAQRKLESLSYSQNELGSQGLAQLKRLVEMQQELKAQKRQYEEAPLILSSLKFNCCKVIGDSLSLLSKMIDETQLNLRSLRISDQRIGAAFPITIEVIRFQQNLQYLNVSNSALKPAQMVTLVEKLIGLKTLRTLILSNNPVPPINPNKTPNKTHQEFMQNLHTFMLTQENLTLLNICNMFLGFESLLQFCHKAITPALLSLHISGNQIDHFQMQMLVSAIGVSIGKFEENREANAVNQIYVEVDKYGNPDLVKKLDKRNVEPESLVNMKKILNSTVYKQQILKQQEYESNDGAGVGRNQTYTFDTQCILNKGTSGEWEVVKNCFITNKHRYCVLFMRKDDHDQQYFFQTIQQELQVKEIIEEQIKANGLQQSEVPVILGGLASNQAEPMQESIEYWEWLQNSLPQDYRVKHNNDDTYMRLKQELVQKLAAIGHMDPMLINAPSVQSENNQSGLTAVLSNHFVFAGYVPPGKHSVVIKTRKNSKNYLHKNIVVEPNSFDYLGPFRISPQPVDSFMRDWIFETHEERLQKLNQLMEHWTAKEIFEDISNKQQVVQVIARNYEFIRYFQLEIATRAENKCYPFIHLHRWAQLLQGSGLFAPDPTMMQQQSIEKVSSSFQNLLFDKDINSVPVLNKDPKEREELSCSKSDNCLVLHRYNSKKSLDDADPDHTQNPQTHNKYKLASGERYSNSFKKFIVVDTAGFIQNIIKLVHMNNSDRQNTKDVVNSKNLQEALDKLASFREQLNSRREPQLEIATLLKDKDTLKIYSVNFPHIVNLFMKLTSSKRRFNYDSISKLVTAGVDEATLQNCFFRAKMFSQEPIVLNFDEHQQWLKELDFIEFQVFLALSAHQKVTKPTKANPIVTGLGLAQKVQNQFDELFKVHLGVKPADPIQ